MAIPDRWERSVFGAALLGALACGPQTANMQAPELDIDLPDIEGNSVRPRAERGDEVFVLAFWATWCQPCQQELSKLNRVHEERHEQGLRIYGINIDGPDTAAQVAPWVQREGYRFPVLLDRETLLLTRYNPRGDIPYYVVLDGEGRVLKDHQGYMTGDIEELDAFLQTVLRPAE